MDESQQAVSDASIPPCT